MYDNKKNIYNIKNKKKEKHDHLLNEKLVHYKAGCNKNDYTLIYAH